MPFFASTIMSSLLVYTKKHRLWQKKVAEWVQGTEYKLNQGSEFNSNSPFHQSLRVSLSLLNSLTFLFHFDFGLFPISECLMSTKRPINQCVFQAGFDLWDSTGGPRSLCSTEPDAFAIIYLALKCLKRRGLEGPGIADENIPRYTCGARGNHLFSFQTCVSAK